MLSWENLAKSYQRRLLFSGVSGRLAPGGGVLVLGPNGSGKSTLLRLLAGLTRPDEGTVRRPAEPRLAIGYASPQGLLYGELTGLENARFSRAARGLPADDQALRALLHSVGLGRAMNRAAGAYSTGMTQRLRLACALAHGPDVLILDEPTIGLDEDGIAVVERAVAGHRARLASRRGGETGGPGGVIIATNDPRHFVQDAAGDGGAGAWERVTVGG